MHKRRNSRIRVYRIKANHKTAVWVQVLLVENQASWNWGMNLQEQCIKVGQVQEGIGLLQNVP